MPRWLIPRRRIHSVRLPVRLYGVVGCRRAVGVRDGIGIGVSVGMCRRNGGDDMDELLTVAGCIVG